MVGDELIVSEPLKYTFDYDDDTLCTCGHTYYNHFDDTYEGMLPSVCHSCLCGRFQEA